MLAAFLASAVLTLVALTHGAVPGRSPSGSGPFVILPVVTPAPSVVSPAASAAPSPASLPETAAAPSVVDAMRIRVPRLGIDLPLQEGDPSRDVPSTGGPGATPEGAAFHYPGTAVPGSPGNAFVYAHARFGMFLSLWNAHVGDEVDILLPGGSVLRYAVTEIHPRVAPSDTSWLRPTADERLTLQTSTGPNGSYPRFIVVAERVG